MLNRYRGRAQHIRTYHNGKWYPTFKHITDQKTRSKQPNIPNYRELENGTHMIRTRMIRKQVSFFRKRRRKTDVKTSSLRGEVGFFQRNQANYKRRLQTRAFKLKKANSPKKVLQTTTEVYICTVSSHSKRLVTFCKKEESHFSKFVTYQIAISCLRFRFLLLLLAQTASAKDVEFKIGQGI